MKSILILSLRPQSANRVVNMSAEKSSKKGFAILFVGVMIGIGVGIAACVTTMVHPATATASEKSVAVAARPAKPLPSLYPPPPQTAPLNAGYDAVTAPLQPDQSQSVAAYQQPTTNFQPGLAPAPAPAQGISQGTAIQSQDGSLLMPGVNAYATTAQAPAATMASYEATPDTITAGHVNPNWTIGKNGLIQNPCVDPPSAHGRQTGQY